MATREPDAFEEGLLKLVTDVVGSVATFVATRTQLGKSIFETTDQFRQYLVEAGIHDYRSQRFGPEARAVRPGLYWDGTAMWETPVSFNRARTRGDARFWVPAMRGRASANDLLAVGGVEAGSLALVVNLTQTPTSAVEDLRAWLSPGQGTHASPSLAPLDEDDAGRNASPEERRVMEMYSRKIARAYFQSHGWPDIEETSGSVPFDLVAIGPEGVLYVEVKSTKGSGTVLNVTAGEVAHALEAPLSALFLVAHIEISGGPGALVAQGGRSSVVLPWKPDASALTATAFRYVAPPMLQLS